MPIQYARRLAGRSRSPDADRHLGCLLACVAGVTNAVGFGLAGHYTSHMTGMVSTLGERALADDPWLAIAAASAIAAFVAGAACCTLMVHHARRRRLHAQFAWPLLLEATLILTAGAIASSDGALAGLQAWRTICLLTFAMGLQNALITKISRGEIRTTHVTGIVTDLGIEWGRGIARRLGFRVGIAGTGRARLLVALLAMFTLGCIGGTFAVAHVGRLALVPAALAIGIVALVPAWDDWGRRDGTRLDPEGEATASKSPRSP